MYKNFTLATVVAIIPVTRQNLPANFNSADHVITVPSFLNFKNATKANPFQREKKINRNLVAELAGNSPGKYP